VDSRAVDNLMGVRHGQRQAPIEQAAEQQVHIRAVGLDVAFKERAFLKWFR
jgi:hypothetical protein